MKTTTTLGVVKNGVIVPNMPIPDGVWVEITFEEGQQAFTPDEREEFADWRRLSAGSVEHAETAAQGDADDETGRSLAS